jgi:hypothetical protein
MPLLPSAARISRGAVGNDKSGSQRVMAGNEKEQFRSFLDMPYCQPAGWNG